MAESDINEFVIWYLKREGYDKTASIVEKSIGNEKEKISKKKIRKFKKVLGKLKQEKDWFAIHNVLCQYKYSPYVSLKIKP